MNNITLFIIGVCAVVPARQLYVGPGGNDNGSGLSEIARWATIGIAAQTAQVGDTVNIMAGTYLPADRIMPARSGTTSSPIMYRNHQDATVIIDGQGNIPGWDWDGVFDISGKDHIIVEGLEIRNSRWFGFQVKQCGNVTIRACRTWNTRGSGIYLNGSTGVLVSGNNVHAACMSERQDMGSQECISIVSCVGYEVAHNEVWDRPVDVGWGGEGIDSKGSSRNGRVHHNHVHDLYRLGIYVDPYGGQIDSVEVYGNMVHHCGGGIWIANEVNSGYNRNIRIYNNVIHDNTKRAIAICGYADFNQGDGGPIYNIDIYNNTVWRNGQAGTYEGCGILVEAKCATCGEYRIYNNLLSENGTQISVNSTVASRTSVVRNLIHGATGTSGTSPVTAAPLLADPNNLDFRLLAGSPAIDAAGWDADTS